MSYDTPVSLQYNRSYKFYIFYVLADIKAGHVAGFKPSGLVGHVVINRFAVDDQIFKHNVLHPRTDNTKESIETLPIPSENKQNNVLLP